MFAPFRPKSTAVIYTTALVQFAFVHGLPAQTPKLTALLERSPTQANAMAYVNAPALRKLLADANMPLQLNDNVEEAWFISELEYG